MKYNSIGEQLIAKAKELDPNYKPDKFNDMSEAIDIILNNSGGDIWLDITPYLNEDMASISQEGYDLVSNAFSIATENPINKYVGILIEGNKLIFNRLIDSDLSNKKGFNFILNITIDGVKACIETSIYNDRSIEVKEGIDSSGKIWYELPNLLLLENITQEQFDEIKNLALKNQLAGVNCGGLYCPLTFYQDGQNIIFFYPWYENDIFTAYLIRLDTDLSVKKIPYSTITLPQTTPSSQVIPSITTSNTQQNLTVGDGLAIKNSALTSTLSNFKYGTLCLNNITSGDETLNIELSFFDYIYDSIINGANILLGTSLTRDTFPQYIQQNKSIGLIISLIDNVLTLIRALSMMPYFNITVSNDTLKAYYYNCPIKKDGSSISLFLGNQEMILNTSLTFDDTFTVEYKKSWYGD